MPVNIGMRKKPWQQGHFDGYCGIYSLINAIDHLHHDFSEDDCQKLFSHLIRNSESIDQVVLDGLDFEPLCNIAESIPAFLKGRSKVRFTRPFIGEPIECVREYFDAIQGALTPRCVAIIGLGEPWDHWTVVTEVGKRSVRFCDSYGIKRLNKASFSLEEIEGKIKLDFQETILVERTS